MMPLTTSPADRERFRILVEIVNGALPIEPAADTTQITHRPIVWPAIRLGLVLMVIAGTAAMLGMLLLAVLG